MPKHPTTQPGYINPNKQVNTGPLGLPGTDHNQVLYKMCCMHCGGLYAANGSDVHLRKCPQCQGGNPSSGGWTPESSSEAEAGQPVDGTTRESPAPPSHTDDSAEATREQSEVILAQTLAVLIAIPLSILASWGMAANSEPWNGTDLLPLAAITGAFVWLWMLLLRQLGRIQRFGNYHRGVRWGGIFVLLFVVFTVVHDLSLRVYYGYVVEDPVPKAFTILDTPEPLGSFHRWRYEHLRIEEDQSSDGP